MARRWTVQQIETTPSDKLAYASLPMRSSPQAAMTHFLSVGELCLGKLSPHTGYRRSLARYGTLNGEHGAALAAHTPVLYQEVLESLQPRPHGRYIDATLGGGGHAEGLLEASAPDGRLLGLDADPRAIERTRQRLTSYVDRVVLVQRNFRHLAEVAQQNDFREVDGILLDLGVSSFQLDDPEQGFSFLRDGPLDMRLDPTTGWSAADVVNQLGTQELADIIYRYGEDRHARRIARAIGANRPFTTTSQLAEVVSRAVGSGREARLHPATRTFQALRIYVNDELSSLQEALPQALSLLRRGGVMAIITFHSLEDRIVKQFMRRESSDCICPPQIPVCQCGHTAVLTELYRRGLTPSPIERAQNPRSRSARLRASAKL